MTAASRARALGSALLALGAVAALVVPAPRAHAAPDQCVPPGVHSASAVPANLAATPGEPHRDTHTTATTVPVGDVDVAALGLATPGTLTVGSLSDAPPTSCIDGTGRFTGFDDELLRAVAAKLGLRVAFVGTDFAGLLAQVAAGRFDVGSASIAATEARRRTVGFTNGYDFGYYALVVPPDSALTAMDELGPGQRIGVVQGTIQDAYVVDTLGLAPVKFPDFNTVYAALKTGQLDAWVAPAQQAGQLVRPGDPAVIAATTVSVDTFVAWAVAPGNRPLIDALNAGLDAVIADGTWARLYADWVPRELPPGWRPGSRAAAAPQLPDFAAIAAARPHRETGAAAPSTLRQLRDSFFDWRLYREAIPVLLRTGLPNTLLLTGAAAVIGLVLGLVLALAAIARTRWLRWPARVYTDIFRGLPEVVIILLIGLGLGPVVGGVTNHNPYPLGILALGLMAAAYIGEIFRSGIQSVEPGQMEAARALGFGYPGAMRFVVVPQGIRRVLPALVNQFIALLKASALVYFLGLLIEQRELFQVGRDLNAQTGSLSPLVAAGLFYLALTIPLTHLVNVIDARMRRGRPRAPDPVALAPAGQEMT
ncbi:ABC transporter permease subunit [Mycolicibacillus parakoreensis]|uniref:ABC transporter substrate-binding protein/permease n=1 Tax=Mycolicibacillus parakoreensis TaxID=1069221 RepID=UPI002AF0929A|nr:ABC transporter permease subunit [Mycolicibacillus parakoreensis]